VNNEARWGFFKSTILDKGSILLFINVGVGKEKKRGWWSFSHEIHAEKDY